MVSAQQINHTDFMQWKFLYPTFGVVEIHHTVFPGSAGKVGLQRGTSLFGGKFDKSLHDMKLELCAQFTRTAWTDLLKGCHHLTSTSARTGDMR
jgi:hypothetical protein